MTLMLITTTTITTTIEMDAGVGTVRMGRDIKIMAGSMPVTGSTIVSPVGGISNRMRKTIVVAITAPNIACHSSITNASPPSPPNSATPTSPAAIKSKTNSSSTNPSHNPPLSKPNDAKPINLTPENTLTTKTTFSMCPFRKANGLIRKL